VKRNIEGIAREYYKIEEEIKKLERKKINSLRNEIKREEMTEF